ncbi:Poly-beta-1,6-N-acetyl-D-glucosamine synthase [Aquisphaera giovannonii]|uniref:Poly-beta-1,6-N-acetyl-D-glucosamine synthase n=1 Tax=Aquisphaera giovannonii TaxID=406548 RepID=A0A5B9WD21_9BACT|nr:glycosyltransferase family 2 protein [Aquisphaera giovannonii]QEH37841.1 Poly-beta-1,6-N-acetyl-D-glucosamine synthase [Aquisphaera giovannonii]
MDQIQQAEIVVFWTGFGLVLFSYAVYPVAIWWLARAFARYESHPDVSSDQLPSLSILIVAHNEEEVIKDRVSNALATDYPTDRSEVVVALDGCTDGTLSILQGFRSDRLRVLSFETRQGKSETLNHAFESLSGEIVVLSDANTEFDPGAARRLARWFADPEVGIVCGRLVLSDPMTGRNVDSLYWKYETFLKRCEGSLGALLGANGAIYAIRRKLFSPIPGSTLIDDFVVPLLAKLRSGCRIVYEPTAVAYEETPAEVASEFRRRARIGAGGFQSIAILWRLLDPRRGWVAFSFLGHKVLRWLCPFFLLGMLASNLFLLGSPTYRLALGLQCAFYGLSVLVAYLPRSWTFARPWRLTTMFTMMNAALFVGFWRWLLGTNRGTWARTSRSPRPHAIDANREFFRSTQWR